MPLRAAHKTKAPGFAGGYLLTQQVYNQSDAARSLGINSTMLRRWVKEQESDDGLAFRGNGK
jgi:transposase